MQGMGGYPGVVGVRLAAKTSLREGSGVFLHGGPEVTCSEDASFQCSPSRMKTTYPIMELIHHVLCFLLRQTFK